MPTKISPKEALAAFGISTLHELMENGERRFRLKHCNGNAYVRTEAHVSGQWQNSHYHDSVKETYIVESGWMGFAELIDGEMVLRLISEGEIVTTQPRIVHNVYLSAAAIIHTVKHGPSDGEDKRTDAYCRAFDLITHELASEDAIRATGMRAKRRVIYSDEYRHFDQLIWQVPAWSTAVFALSVEAMQHMIEKLDPQKDVSPWSGGLILLLAFCLQTFAFVMFRFRAHQQCMKGFSSTRPWASASTWTQFLVQIQTTVLLGMHCYPTLDRSGLEFSAWPGSGGLVAPAGFASMIGGIFPIALCGRSSL